MDTIKKVTDYITKAFVLVEEHLANSKIETSMKVVDMIDHVSTAMSLDKSEARLIDPVIRTYFRFSEEWVITPGANGGIRKRDSVKKTNKKPVVSASVKSEVEQEIAAIVAAGNHAKTTVLSSEDEAELNDEVEGFASFDSDDDIPF